MLESFPLFFFFGGFLLHKLFPFSFSFLFVFWGWVVRPLNINGRLWSCEGSSEARCSCANNRYVWINPTNWLKNKKYQCIRTYYLVYKEKLVWLIVWPMLKNSTFLECFWCIEVTPALAVWHSRGLEFNEDSNMVYIYLGADDRFRF